MEEATKTALLAEEVAASRMGTVRVLMVEDDAFQRQNLVALFETANRRNAGVVTFDVSGVCPKVLHQSPSQLTRPRGRTRAREISSQSF